MINLRKLVFGSVLLLCGIITNPAFTAEPPGKDIVAEAFGVSISKEDVLPNKFFAQQAKQKLDRKKYREWEAFQSRQMLANKLWLLMMKDLLSKNNAMPSEQDVALLAKSLMETNKLKTDPAKMRANYNSTLNLAKDLAWNWSANKILYQKYGGKVIVTEAGIMEPVEAMISFLDDARSQNLYTIHNIEFAEPFSHFYEFAQKPTSAPTINPDDYFSKPWWVASVN